jgi:hypothetical protein
VIATKAVTRRPASSRSLLPRLVPGPELDLEPPLAYRRSSCAWLGTKAGGRILESVSDAGFRRWTGRIVIALSLVYVWRGATGLGLPAPW